MYLYHLRLKNNCIFFYNWVLYVSIAVKHRQQYTPSNEKKMADKMDLNIKQLYKLWENGTILKLYLGVSYYQGGIIPFLIKESKAQ